MLVWMQLVSFKMVLSWWRNLNFHFHEQTCFPSIWFVQVVLMEMNTIFVMLDVCWGYWCTWLGFLYISKFQVAWGCWMYAVHVKHYLPRKFSWLCMVVAEWCCLYQYHVVCVLVEICFDVGDNMKMPWPCCCWNPSNFPANLPCSRIASVGYRFCFFVAWIHHIIAILCEFLMLEICFVVVNEMAAVKP